MSSEYDDCIKKGMLRKIPSDKNSTISSFQQANSWLQEAEKARKGGALKSALYGAYMAMFHSARAILYKDGYREKSHYCIARYIEEMYVKTGKLEKEWVDLLDYYRENRHHTQYDINFPVAPEDDEKAIKTARKFYKRMKKMSE